MTLTKIILTEDIEKLGNFGQVVRVRPGYARNYLIPFGLAVKWTKASQDHYERLLKQKSIREIGTVEDAELLRERIIEHGKFTLLRRCGKEGKLFGSVTSRHIAQEINLQFKVSLTAKDVNLDDAIKSIGEYDVELNLHPDVSVVLQIIVLPVEE